MRPVQWPSAGNYETIILDSGSDVSLLPPSFGANSFGSNHQLQDCQGNALGVSGTKEAEILVQDASGECLQPNNSFVVGDVTSCLMSLGRLYASGWSIVHEPGCGENGLGLKAPDGEALIPVFYKGMSLAIQGQIRCVSRQPKIGEVDESLSEAGVPMVRYVVSTQSELEETSSGRWHYSPSGWPFFKRVGKAYLDARGAWGETHPYCSTFFKPLDSSENKWQWVEWREKMLDLDDAGADIEECSNVDVMCLTMVTNAPISIDIDFTVLDDGDLDALAKVEARQEQIRAHDEHERMAEEEAMRREGAAVEERADERVVFAAEHDEAEVEDDSQQLPSEVIINGVTYSEASNWVCPRQGENRDFSKGLLLL